MAIPLLWTTEWQEHEARCRVIQHRKLFPRSGRRVAKIERVKPIPVRVDKQLDALVAGEIPGAADTRRKRRR